RASGAGLHAQPAHDAAQVVDLVDLRIALPRRDPVLFGVFGALHVDGIRRARPRAQLAPDALLQAVVVAIEQVASDVGPGEQRRDLLRVLLGDVPPEDLAEG